MNTALPQAAFPARKRPSSWAVVALTIAGFVASVTSAQAAIIVAWDFENASNGQISGIAASSAAPVVTGGSFSTGNNGVETFPGPVSSKVSVTRFFGDVNFPSLSFTLSSAADDVSLSFRHYHNHNTVATAGRNYPTAPQYEFDVQWRFNGGAWSDIAANNVASNATSGQLITVSNIDFTAGTYDFRWVGNNFNPNNDFNNGENSHTEFFALDNVTFTAPDPARVPEPTGLALVALGLLAAGISRKRR